jgi:hypothetical protein
MLRGCQIQLRLLKIRVDMCIIIASQKDPETVFRISFGSDDSSIIQNIWDKDFAEAYWQEKCRRANTEELPPLFGTYCIDQPEEKEDEVMEMQAVDEEPPTESPPSDIITPIKISWPVMKFNQELGTREITMKERPIVGPVTRSSTDRVVVNSPPSFNTNFVPPILKPEEIDKELINPNLRPRYIIKENDTKKEEDEEEVNTLGQELDSTRM